MGKRLKQIFYIRGNKYGRETFDKMLNIVITHENAK